MAEVQVWGQQSSATADVEWMVTDQLGTPRMVLDQSGSLAGEKRHDYLPFGEELFAGTGGRTTSQGYMGDAVRQQFTSKERDSETGLDYFEARYFSSTMGRFTSPDEFAGGPDQLFYFEQTARNNPLFYAELEEPQTLNKYAYCLNNPLRYVDPDGHQAMADALRQTGEELGSSGVPGLQKAGEILIGGAAVITAASEVDWKKVGEGFTEVFKGSGPGCLAGIDCRPYMLNQSNEQNGSANQDNNSGRQDDNTSEEPQPVSKKEAVKEAHKQVGKQNQRGTGKFGSPMRGNSKKGYRLDPPNPNGKGLEKNHKHINWWDYSKGKKGRGGRKDYIPIKHKE